MSDLEEDEDDMPEDKDSTCSGIASEDKGDKDRDGEDEVVVADFLVADLDRDGDGETRGEDEEEDSSDDFFDAGEAPSSAPTASPYAPPRRAAKVAAAARKMTLSFP